MKFKQIHRAGQRAGILLVLISIAWLNACSSSGLSKKQREAMDHYVDETADAILFSATKVKNLLSAYKDEKGGWPKDAKERRQIFNNIGEVLREHHISKQKLLEVDKNEVIVEYELSADKFKQFPQLLESWVIIFSNEKNKDLEIVSIYPHWCDTQEMIAKSHYSETQVEKLRVRFQKLLQDKLNIYSITLSDHINEKS
ncbi:hypothetical protein [Kaarinaea lacus]